MGNVPPRLERLPRQTWRRTREYGTKWLVRTVLANTSTWLLTGLVVAATGAAPMEWIARALRSVNISEDALHLWGTHVDLRVAIVFTGMAIIVSSVLWQHKGMRPTPANCTAMPAGHGAIPGPTTNCSGPNDERAPRLSIVVLPFTNIGGNPDQEYFADGVTESLTTDLSRIAGAFVVARNTAFTYKEKSFDVKAIGRELGVRYVLEGSVQRSDNRMRVNVQLIDAESGAHLWADRFDKPVADLFDMQDEIVALLAGTLSTHLVAAEARRAERAPDPDSMDLYFRGMACINHGETPEYAAQAKEFFARALTLDPGNVEALVGSAFVDSVVATHMFSIDRMERLAAAEAAATKALSLAPSHAWAHMVLGNIQIFTKRPLQGIAQCEHALALDRNLAMAHAYIGSGKISIGRGEETEAHVAEALRLSPRDTTAYVWMAAAGAAKLYLGADEAAVTWLRRAIENNRNQAIAHFWLAAALTSLGRVDEARTAAQAGLALDPAFTVARFQSSAATDNAVYLRQRARVCETMRKAGVPEG